MIHQFQLHSDPPYSYPVTTRSNYPIQLLSARLRCAMQRAPPPSPRRISSKRWLARLASRVMDGEYTKPTGHWQPKPPQVTTTTARSDSSTAGCLGTQLDTAAARGSCCAPTTNHAARCHAAAPAQDDASPGPPDRSAV